MNDLPKSHINDISIGDHLYSTCGADIVGTVVDINDVDMTIDMIMYDGANCFIDMDDDSDVQSEIEKMFYGVPLLAPDIRVDYLYEINQEDGEDLGEDFKFGIQLKPSWGGCNRCVASFYVLNKNVSDHYYKNMTENCWSFGQPLPQDYNKYLILK